MRTTMRTTTRLFLGFAILAAAACGALTAGAAAEPIAALTAYAKNLGLAFQIIDDLLDVAGTTADTGKAVLADARKTTFVSFLASSTYWAYSVSFFSSLSG